MDLNTITLDFESFYAADYTLDKMTTESYVRDPRFEMIMCSVKFDATPAQWLLPERFAFWVDEVDWANTVVVMHHAHFDGLILAHHFGVIPGFFIDTLSMARYVDGPNAGNSLRDICIRKGIGFKGTYLQTAKGKHLDDFTRDELHEFGRYCCNDSDRTYDAAMLYMQEIPDAELRLIDHNIRMFTEPVLRGNTALLTQAVAGEIKRKQDLLLRVSEPCLACRGTGLMTDLLGAPIDCAHCDGFRVSKKPFTSADKFATLLRDRGVEPPLKPNNAGTDMIYAFAKTDPGMQELLEDPDEEIRFLAEARIGIKSTLVESRAVRFLASALNGPMPVYLKYAGAHTRRRSGGDKMNFQNLGRADAKRAYMILLKQSLEAPDGHMVVASDSAQIQARLTAWFCGSQELVHAFAAGRDVYSEFASKIYRRPVDRVNIKEDFIAGFVGKTCTLGLGFQMGWVKFAIEMLKGALGGPPVQFTMKDIETMGINPQVFLNNPRHVERADAIVSRLDRNDLLIHCIVCQDIVKRWREANQENVEGWYMMERVIHALARKIPMEFGPGNVCRTEGERIIHVTGSYVEYKDIQLAVDGSTYWDGRKRANIYGGLMLENVVQWLETIVMNEDLIETIDEGYKIVLQGHDELVAITADARAVGCLAFMVDTMKRPPTWAPTLPLSAAGGMGKNYADAKPK